MANYREEASDHIPAMARARMDEYSYRVPAPPRIVVPPPSLNTEAIPDFKIGRITYEGNGQSDSVDLRFLSDFDYNGIIESSSLLEWTYERRWQAQMILPFLFLGPMAAAKNKDFLKKHGITMILAIRHGSGVQSKLMAGAFKVADELAIARDVIDLSNGGDLIAAFPQATRLMNQHLSDTYAAARARRDANPRCGNILVFCESGNEKSAAVVAAYMMEVLHDVDYIKAMQICIAQRFCTNFDDAIKPLLRTYWDILCAKRDVGQAKMPFGGECLQANPAIHWELKS